ncbi:energy transducer TonB [Sphingomonas sp. Root710]|uniref:energy transducer TonB n=1 Tax=Sphingomonas sp. Root710 TaxID=1736594 RepID=UPI0006F8A2F3|nr:energy transducer TonB [Sphingomonas sp. Root710]KRB82678.1 energy transducer TonB [Sphingomonas sp. Root710]
MHEGGFLTARKPNRIGLGLVVAGHAAVLTALALAPPEAVQRIVFVDTIVKSIEDQPPPPVDKQPPAPKAEPQAQPTTVEPLIKATNLDPVIIAPSRPIDPPPIPTIEPVRSEPVTTLPVIDPAAMARFQPDYPPELIRADIEGSATVRVLIGSDGRVKAVEMVSATHPGFFEATRKQALRFWRFKPGTRDGVPAESWRTMTVRFKIQS